MCLHQKVKDLCNEKGITIYRMCMDTGIAQNTVSNWKDRPDAKPELDIALKMSDYFGVNPKHFLNE